MTSRILYKSSVSRDLKKSARQDVGRILKQIQAALGKNPQSGERLHGEFEGLFKLRTGEYRVVYALSGGDVVVLRSDTGPRRTNEPARLAGSASTRTSPAERRLRSARPSSGNEPAVWGRAKVYPSRGALEAPQGGKG